MSDKRQKNQLGLAFREESRSEALKASTEGTESLAAECRAESPAIGERLMEEVCERENCKQALARVKANKGSPGVDGMTVRNLPGFLKQRWPVNIYVRSRRAGERVMKSITRFITTKLKLRVNEQKSAVARPWERKFLGFSFTWNLTPKRRIAPKAVLRFKERVRELTRRTRGVSTEKMAEDLTRYLRGWIGYFGKCETPSVLQSLEEWTRRRLRSAIWKQWKRGRTRFAELRKRGVGRDLAAKTAGSAHGPWRLANSPALAFALPNAYFETLGIPPLIVRR